MCADYAIHNPPITDSKGILLDADGNRTQDPDKMIFHNPHAHIMLTMRPLSPSGEWQSKSQKCYLCRKGNEQKSIPASEYKEAETEGWRKQYQYRVGKKKIWLIEESAARRDLKQISKKPKSEKALNPLIADWNSKDSLFQRRESWANMCNSTLLEHGINEQITHESYESQGINKVASVHLGPPAYPAEKRGVQTDLGNLNREIADDNEFLKRFEDRIKKLEESETERLKQVSARLEGLRASYIAGACQQICLSATLATEQDQNQTQMAIAAAYDEFYRLVEESKGQMQEIREIIRGTGPMHDNLTEQALKEHHAETFQQKILEKARLQGPELPGAETGGIQNTIKRRH